MNYLVSTVTVALGVFVTLSPEKAARIWGRRQLDKLAPAVRAFYLGCYRVLGVMLCMAGMLFAAESIWFPN
jgi:hypothetical protein